MKLGIKTRNLLELLSVVGLETFEGILRLPQLYRVSSFGSPETFNRQLRAIVERGWAAGGEEGGRGGWTLKLTERGEELISDGFDPEKAWNMRWDGSWRLFAFDLPKEHGRERQALRNWMRRRRFGKLQGSVWITPHAMGDWEEEIDELDVDLSELLMFEGKLLGRRARAVDVSKVWKFGKVNQLYSEYLDFLKRDGSIPRTIESFPSWFETETGLWRRAFEADPFLPRELWGEDFDRTYLGPKAFEARREVFAQLAGDGRFG